MLSRISVVATVGLLCAAAGPKKDKMKQDFSARSKMKEGGELFSKTERKKKHFSSEKLAGTKQTNMDDFSSEKSGGKAAMLSVSSELKDRVNEFSSEMKMRMKDHHSSDSIIKESKKVVNCTILEAQESFLKTAHADFITAFDEQGTTSAKIGEKMNQFVDGWHEMAKKNEPCSCHMKPDRDLALKKLQEKKPRGKDGEKGHEEKDKNVEKNYLDKLLKKIDFETKKFDIIDYVEKKHEEEDKCGCELKKDIAINNTKNSFNKIDGKEVAGTDGVDDVTTERSLEKEESIVSAFKVDMETDRKEWDENIIGKNLDIFNMKKDGEENIKGEKPWETCEISINKYLVKMPEEILDAFVEKETITEAEMTTVLDAQGPYKSAAEAAHEAFLSATKPAQETFHDESKAAHTILKGVVDPAMRERKQTVEAATESFMEETRPYKATFKTEMKTAEEKLDAATTSYKTTLDMALENAYSTYEAAIEPHKTTLRTELEQARLAFETALDAGGDDMTEEEYEAAKTKFRQAQKAAWDKFEAATATADAAYYATVTAAHGVYKNATAPFYATFKAEKIAAITTYTDATASFRAQLHTAMQDAKTKFESTVAPAKATFKTVMESAQTKLKVVVEPAKAIMEVALTTALTAFETTAGAVWLKLKAVVDHETRLLNAGLPALPYFRPGMGKEMLSKKRDARGGGMSGEKDKRSVSRSLRKRSHKGSSTTTDKRGMGKDKTEVPASQGSIRSREEGKKEVTVDKMSRNFGKEVAGATLSSMLELPADEVVRSYVDRLRCKEPCPKMLVGYVDRYLIPGNFTVSELKTKLLPKFVSVEAALNLKHEGQCDQTSVLYAEIQKIKADREDLDLPSRPPKKTAGGKRGTNKNNIKGGKKQSGLFSGTQEESSGSNKSKQQRRRRVFKGTQSSDWDNLRSGITGEELLNDPGVTDSIRLGISDVIEVEPDDITIDGIQVIQFSRALRSSSSASRSLQRSSSSTTTQLTASFGITLDDDDDAQAEDFLANQLSKPEMQKKVQERTNAHLEKAEFKTPQLQNTRPHMKNTPSLKVVEESQSLNNDVVENTTTLVSNGQRTPNHLSAQSANNNAVDATTSIQAKMVALPQSTETDLSVPTTTSGANNMFTSVSTGLLILATALML